MINFYSGTPGSGKSLHVARVIYNNLRAGKTVIANFPINLDLFKNKKKIGKFIYKENFDLTPQFFLEYAKNELVLGKESQVLVVIDECQIIFNPRSWQDKSRIGWINFFTQHRKYGYDFIMISQFDRLVDRQIRSLFEYEIKHRKVNNFKFGKFIPVSAFALIKTWYSVNEKIDVNYMFYSKKIASLYNTFYEFN